MKILRQTTLMMTALLFAMAALVLTGPSAALAAGLANPSFEPGDLSGWSTSIPSGGFADVRVSYGSYAAVDGSYFALLKTNGGGSFTTVSQTFSASAGDKISGQAFFYTIDYMPFNDNAQVEIISGGSVVATVFSANVSTGGSTPWTYWEYTFTAADTYTVEARVANWFDSAVDSHMGLDAVIMLTVDNTAPVITINAPTDGASYTSATLPAASFSATDNLDPSPSVSQTGYGTTEGTHTMTVTATDAAGNTATASVSYTGLPTGLPTGLGPKDLKQDAIDKLSVHAGESKKIDKAIKEIEKSLDDQLWVDDTHIDPKHGKKVFDREHRSVKELMHLLKGIPDDGKFGGVSLIELEYTGPGTVIVEVYLKNLLLGTFTVSTGDTFVVEATEETGWKLHSEIKLFIDSVEVAKIHTSGSKPLDIGDVCGDFIVADLDKLPPKSGKKDQVSDEALTAAETAINQLVKADRILAETKLEEAGLLTPLDPAKQEKFEKEIAKADDELAKGDADRDSGKFDKTISHYKKAWEHANHAEKEATKPPKP